MIHAFYRIRGLLNIKSVIAKAITKPFHRIIVSLNELQAIMLINVVFITPQVIPLLNPVIHFHVIFYQTSRGIRLTANHICDCGMEVRELFPAETHIRKDISCFHAFKAGA